MLNIKSNKKSVSLIIVFIFCNFLIWSIQDLNIRFASLSSLSTTVSQSNYKVINYQIKIGSINQRNTIDLSNKINVNIDEIELNNLGIKLKVDHIKTTIDDLIKPTNQIPFISASLVKNQDLARNTKPNLASLIISLVLTFILYIIYNIYKYIVEDPIISKSSIQNESHHKYRPDIDVLRAFAVISVIIFHINENLLPGGFVGVDIFFVISGYLISKIIYKEILNKSFSFKLFYARRIKRILPTLYTMLFILGGLGLFILPSGTMNNLKLSESINSNIFYVYNFYLLHNSNGYFDNPENQQFLLHTWSLAVEEQFYLIFPVILILCNKLIRNRRTFVGLIGFLTITSLIYSIYYSYNNQLIAYYMLPSRAFELLIGVMISIFEIMHLSGIDNSNKVKPNKYAHLFSIIGVLMMCFSLFIINKNCPFPGFVALLPTIGAACFILGGCYSNKFNQFLSKEKTFIFIGILSYSLYIWHWPILAIYRFENPMDNISLPIGILLLLIIFVISVFNYFLIENRIRKMLINYKNTIVFLFIVPAVIILLESIALHSELVKKPDRLLKEETGPVGYCFNGETGDCIYGGGDYSLNHILLIGDSHAASYGPFLENIGSLNKINFEMHSSSGCPPIIDNGCFDYMKFVKKRDSIVILAAVWSHYYKNKHLMNNLAKTIKTLNKLGIKVIVLGDVPHYKTGVIDYIQRRNIIKNRFNLDYTVRSSDLMAINDPSGELVKEIAVQNGAYYYDFKKLVSNNIKTYPFYEGFLVYSDSEHLNLYGSFLLSTYIKNTKAESDLLELLEQ